MFVCLFVFSEFHFWKQKIFKNIKVHMTLFWNSIHLTSLSPPPLIEMPVRSQERQRSLVLEVATLPLSTLFLLTFRNVSTVCGVLLFSLSGAFKIKIFQCQIRKHELLKLYFTEMSNWLQLVYSCELIYIVLRLSLCALVFSSEFFLNKIKKIYQTVRTVRTLLLMYWYFN